MAVLVCCCWLFFAFTREGRINVGTRVKFLSSLFESVAHCAPKDDPTEILKILEHAGSHMQNSRLYIISDAERQATTVFKSYFGQFSIFVQNLKYFRFFPEINQWRAPVL